MSDEKKQAAGEVPSAIGRYQITGTLGFGAMGAVYRAFDPLIKRTLAIKTIRLDIPRQSPQHQAFIERFYQEARISGTLSHPNIVTLFDIGEENGVPFLAMELVDGKTIGAILEEGTRFKPEKVIGLVSQVAAALDYAHSRGVVHRDIKPSNLIVHEADKVKVTDFGIAKLADSEITHAGALLGTPSYMSPEQAMGEKLDGRSDIFSLGVVAFEMLSGQQPFPGANVTSILYRLVHVDPVEPANLEMNGLVPAEVARGLPQGPRQEAGEPLPDGRARSCRTSSTASAPGSPASGTRRRSACRCPCPTRARSRSPGWPRRPRPGRRRARRRRSSRTRWCSPARPGRRARARGPTGDAEAETTLVLEARSRRRKRRSCCRPPARSRTWCPARRS